ncbi:hypothetical protein ABW19_dt0200623 [Dactylella cylindrospora]|nr:hypothetical protein ABW19_dt0200623 [Dactylella cylindrospora]
MATFGYLSVDIIYLIMANAADLDTLVSLALVSQQCCEVFRRYKATLQQTVSKQEIHQHKRESHFVATFGETLRQADSYNYAGLSYILKQYHQFEDGPPNLVYVTPDFATRRWHSHNTPLSEETLLENHRAIRRACNLLIQREFQSQVKKKSLETTPAATPVERQRVISALYKLWVFVLFYCRRTDRQAGIRNVLPNDDLPASLFDTWGFWDFMAVKMVKDFYWDQLLPYAVAYRKDKWFPPHHFERVGLQMEVLAFLQFSLLMLHQFPGNINKWIENNHKPKKIMQELRELWHTAYIDDARYAEPTSRLPELFPSYLNCELASNIFSPLLQRKRQNNWREVPKRRLCQPGHIPFEVGEKEGFKSWVRPFNWRDKIDARVCLWDDWRLESWGYIFPIFAEEKSSGLLNRLKEYEQAGYKWNCAVEGDEIALWSSCVSAAVQLGTASNINSVAMPPVGRRLEDLSIDLKHVILEHITDVETLFSLILASRPYNSVFQTYKHSILLSVWQNEIARYWTLDYDVRCREDYLAVKRGIGMAHTTDTYNEQIWGTEPRRPPWSAVAWGNTVYQPLQHF